MAEAGGEKTVTFAESLSAATESVTAAIDSMTGTSSTTDPSNEVGAVDTLTSVVAAVLAPAAKPKGKKAPAPAPAPAPGAALEQPKRKRRIPVPKDSASFFNARAKDVKAFVFTKDGDLSVPEMNGEPAKIIELPFYRQATIDEIRENEETIKDKLSSVEQEFDETAKLLRDSIANWRSTGMTSEVLQHQRTLARLDAERTMIRSPLRWVKEFKNPTTKDILLEKVYEQRKMGYDVGALTLRTMTFTDMVRVGKEAVIDERIAIDTIGDEEEESFIFFFDPADSTYGILSPDTMVEFVFNSTKYTSILQAYEVERVTMIGRKDMRTLLLRQRNPKQIRTLAAGIVGKVENPVELWIMILKAVAAQDTRYRTLLEGTGDDTLVYADPRNEVLGIGIPMEDPASMDRKNWKGENMIGQAWEAVRASLGIDEGGVVKAEESKMASTTGGGYTEHGKTEAERKEERARVFRGGYYRRR